MSRKHNDKRWLYECQENMMVAGQDSFRWAGYTEPLVFFTDD